jgi:AcrR family transcriptional regulator
VAERAGVSEASVFYHYGDRAGLLQAVFVRGLEPLKALGTAGVEGEAHEEVLGRLGGAVERFLDEVMPVLVAAQSDTELRGTLAAYMAEHDLGPHRGVQALGEYLAAEQAAGRVRADADPAAAALMLISSSFMRVFQRQLSGQAGALPPLDDTVAALSAMLQP